MMKTKWFLRAFAIVAGISFASCNDKEVVPVFPQVTEYTVAAGETKELTFTANTPWMLSRDTPWCVFMNGEEEVEQMIGAAGTVTVTLKVKDTNQDFNNARTVKINLTMQGKSQTIFEINRPVDQRRVTMFKRESGAWVEIQKVELVYSKGETVPLQIGFTANYDWIVLSKSDEIVMGTELSGEANKTTSDASFKNSYISLPKGEIILSEPFSGEIVISDLNGENTASFDVTYAGMSDEDLFFDVAHLRAGFDASLNFSNKGYVMSRESTPQPTEEMSFTFKAITKGMKSTGYVVSYDGETAQIATNPWLVLTPDGDGDYTIAVDGAVNLSDARNLHVFILPETLATTTPDFSSYFADGESKGIYNFKVAQAAAPTGGGLFIGWGENQTAIADGRLIAWNDHPEYGANPNPWERLNPSDMGAYGLQADNAYIYEFSNTDIDGDMVIAPYGITLGGFNKTDSGTAIGTAAAGMFQGVFSVILSDIETIDSGGRRAWVTFNDGVSLWTPKMGVYLVQVP